MPWDSDKSTASDPDNPAPDEQLTADEWDQHVTDGHWASDELNMGTDANGNPVLTDPANGDQVVATYNKSTGTWELPAVSTGQVLISGLKDATIERDIETWARPNDRNQSLQTFSGDVGTAATPIADTSRGVFLFVSGIDGNVNRFYEIVVAARSGVTVGTTQETGTPAARSYSIDGSKIELAMGSDTYAITAWGIEVET